MSKDYVLPIVKSTRTQLRENSYFSLKNLHGRRA